MASSRSALGCRCLAHGPVRPVHQSGLESPPRAHLYKPLVMLGAKEIHRADNPSRATASSAPCGLDDLPDKETYYVQRCEMMNRRPMPNREPNPLVRSP